MRGPGPARFVSRAGEKLTAALDHFRINPAGRVCADLGSQVGGFVDCLLQRGAARVYSVDTAYGVLAWKLRQDPKVVVLERTNALRLTLPQAPSLITVDVGWTRQAVILPRARDLLAEGGVMVSLIKPHYEVEARRLHQGVLPDDEFDRAVERVRGELHRRGLATGSPFESPLRGHGGNRECFVLVQP